MKKRKKRYLLTYNLLFMNIVSLVLFLLCIGLLFLFFKLGLLEGIVDNSLRFLQTNKDKWFDFYFFLLMIGIFLWMILHELIHGLFYKIMGASFENITFGMVIEKGIFYCKCGEDIERKNILVSVIAPFILLGIVPFIVGILLSSFTLLFLAIINISGCGGDLIVFFFFLGRKSDCKFREIGDSTSFSLVTEEQLLEKNFIGLKVVKEIEEKELPHEKEKKVTISKISKIILFFIGFILLLSCIKYFL